MATGRGHDKAMQIIHAVRAACDPRSAMARAVKDRPPHCRRPAVIAAGKAAASMYEGYLDSSPEPASRFMVVPEGTPAPQWALRADHPLPTDRCIAAAKALIEFVRETKESGACDGFVVLLSGGSSALLTLPFENISLEQYASAIEYLLHSGRNIQEINTIRKHCEQLKGGRLAVLMHPMPCDAYLLSDVVGDDPSSIGSGPTVPDPTTMAKLHTFYKENELSPYGKHVHPLTRGLPETPKPGDPRLANSRYTIVGSNAIAVNAAVVCARRLGYTVPTPEIGVVEEAGAVGKRLGALARASDPNRAIILGGETVVLITNPGGRGGRNQHIALTAAIEIDGRRDITIASFATDGVDGRTDAAGAIVTGDTCRTAREHGLDPAAFRDRYDSYTFFDSLDQFGHEHLIRTGPTGTNVNDIAFALVHGPR